ncbi:MAG: amino acid adenylation domain-containing protein [Pseudomonadota bacterium]
MPVVNVLGKSFSHSWVVNEGSAPKAAVHDIFAQLASEQSDRIALELGRPDAPAKQKLTYGELNRHSDDLAFALIADGVVPGDVVAVQTDRSFDLIIALLAILKAGAAYLPLDPSYPADRLAFMVEDSGAARIVLSDGIMPSAAGLSPIVVGATGPRVDLPAASADDLAYVIYTSGSTGKPKGVMTPHRGIARLVVGAEFTQFDADQRFLQMAPVAFDAATLEIWGPLLNGGTCVIYPGAGLPDFDALAGVLAQSRITTLWLTSSLFNAVVDRDPKLLDGLHALLVGGEALSVPHIRRALDALDCAIINGYGPTETTTFACTYEIPRDLPADAPGIPIGKPINRTAIAVLDDRGEPVGVGEAGELCIAGDGLALGYLNRAETTAERFIDEPRVLGERYYRTGDLVCQDTDGNVIFLGRQDSQVKLAGYRIELGEIEAALKARLDVTDAAVIVDGEGTGRRLAAFIVGADLPDDHVLRNDLAAGLPDHMLPAVFQRLDSLPLTENGKLDRKALTVSRRRRPDLRYPYAAPRGPREQFVAMAWEEMLGVDGIGRADRFFELGGSSLMATQFIEMCRAEKGFDLTVAEFFSLPTPEHIAEIWVSREAAPTLATRTRRAADRPTGNDQIAIVGVSARAAGADTAHELWDLMVAGKSGRVDITADDLIAAGFSPELLDDPDFVPSSYPLKNHKGFDHKFFGFTPREIEIMDPQQRIMLEAAWMALEDAGHDTQQGGDRIGVFGGVGRNAYQLENLMSVKRWRDMSHDYSVMIGNERDFPCTHIAYRLSLTGPAMTVQTACSTSGTAIHLAAESLRKGECDMALAGGAKFLVPHRAGYMYHEGGPLTPSGRIAAFDAKADGMIRGSGVAMLAMKRLDDAIAEGDNIYAVMIGSAVNNDGANKAGFSAPSSIGQSDVIAEAYLNAGITADDVSLIEAHGTGTLLGDPIEIEGLTRAFRETTDRKQFCAIGSIKTNTGHLDAGATAAGTVKAALALKHGVIPPSLNFSEPNPAIPFADSPFFVAGEALAWPKGDVPRRAGISSFGMGGTNAHIVIQEAPQIAPSDPAVGPQLIVLSAKTDTALTARCEDLADWLDANRDANLADVAYTLLTGRRRMEKRLAFLASSVDEAIAKLRARNPREMIRSAMAADEAELVFLFAGGGAQYAGMAMGLYDWAPEFRAALDRLDTAYTTATGVSLIEIIRADGTLETPTTALPALYAIEYAMAAQWVAWGAEPSAMIGHSMGEYTAAVMAGVMSPEDGLNIVMVRGELFDTLPEGAMLSVPLGADVVEPRLDASLSIAAVNAEGQCVVSGPVDAIEALRAAFEAEEVETRRVHINVAAHSAMVEPILDRFRRAFEQIELRAPTRPFISNVTGTWITDAEATSPDYWARHLRGTVRFADGVGTLLETQGRVFLELAPGQVLSTLTRQHSRRSADHEISATIRHPRETDPDVTFLLNALGKAWMSGAVLNWKSLAQGRRLKLALPVYRFDRVELWIDPQPYADAIEGGLTPVAPAAETVVLPGADGPRTSTEAPAPAPLAPADKRGAILAKLKAIIHDLSGLPMEAIDEHATFLELGFDSLFLTQANAAFKKAFKVKLNTRQLIEDLPVLDALADYLDGIVAADNPALGAAPVPASVPTPGSADAQAGSDVTPAAAQAGKTAAAPNVQVPSFTKTEKLVLTPAQEAHIDALIAETIRRTPKAKASTQASRRALADPRTVQGFKTRWKEMVYPILSDEAKGAYVWDTDGNKCIDLVGGYGVTFLGHQPDFVVDAIREQSEKSLAIGPQTVLAGEVAQMVTEMTGMERAAFCNTGSEAVLAAVRMARTVTGKSKVAKFDGHYHGIFDEMQVRGSGQGSRLTTFPSAPGIPEEAIQNTIILDYGDPDAFNVIRENADDLALVLVEPVRSRNPDFQPIEYVQALRKLTEELGIPLLFDEIVTGFRCHPKGAQHVFGIRADMATYGKVIGGGLPIGVVTGSALYMDTLDGGHWEFGDDSTPTSDMTWFAGTFVRHPMALATTKAVLEHLQSEGPALQDGMTARAKVLVDELNAFFAQVSAPLKMEQFSSVLRLTQTEFSEYSDLLFFHLRNRGIMTYEGRPIFISAAHTADDLAQVRDAFIDAVNTLIDAGLMQGTRPDGSRIVPLSTNQQEIWLSAQFGPGASCSYNLCSTIELKGALDVAVLERALNDLTDRHEALRTVPNADGETQTIHAVLDLPLMQTDLSELSAAARAEALDAAQVAEVETPFDLANGPLIRAHLLRLGPDHHKLLLTGHHVTVDGWSCGVMVRELGALYVARRDGVAADLPAPIQLSDYLAYLNRADTIEARQEARAYWIDLYKDGLVRVDFPTDRPRPKTRDVAARRMTLDVPAATIDRLTELAAGEGTTLFSALISGFGAYLHRITGVPKNALGFAAAGQPLVGQAPLLGHCVTFLPLQVETQSGDTFESLLRRTGHGLLDALEYQNFDFVSFVKDVAKDRDLDWAPMVTVAINLDAAAKEAPFADFDAVTDSVGRRYEQLDLFINFMKTDTGAELQCTYNLALFDAETIERRMSEYLALLAAAAESPAVPVSRLDVVAPQDRAKLANWQGHAVDYPRDASLPVLFDQIAQSAPDSTALVAADGQEISYGALAAAADAWARDLVARGVKPGDYVGVLLPRGPELIAAYIAIMKAGAAYVPLDAGMPASRVAFILGDCSAQVVLSYGAPAVDLPDGIELVDLAGNPRVWAGELPGASALDPAYLMYTSGSTGQPKGVIVPHRAIARLVLGNDFAQFDPSRRFLQLAPASFDAATFEIWGALLNGATLVLPDADLATDIDRLRDTLLRQRITTLWLTAALFNAIVDRNASALASVQEVLTGGEALSVAHVRNAQAALPNVQLINGYGPTENTTFSCTYPIPALTEEDTSVPIGRPIANTRAYIVDGDLRPVPPGIPGELVVAGDGLALGYLNRPDLTAASFVPAPVLGEDQVYRTGDICRYRSDGLIDFVGRRDGQIKLRGFRVEPGEIEAVMAAVPGIDQAAILHDAERAALFGFYVGAPTLEALTAILRDRLPRHMVPSRLIQLPDMPVTANGKLDRAALVDRIDEVSHRPDDAAPLSTYEVGLAAIWRDLLGIEEIGRDSDFFALGGHSLLAVQLFDRIKAIFGPVMAMSTLFSHPTLSALGRAVEAAQQETADGVDPDAPWDTSVVIHPGNLGSTATPLFIVGGAGGNVNNLAELGRLMGQHRKVVAFQSRGVLGHKPHHTIEEIAAENLHYLAQHQESGPVVLAGYSAGATTAFEMARQLEAKGRKVVALILIDSMAPGFGVDYFDPNRSRSLLTKSGRRRFRSSARMWLRHGPKLLANRIRTAGISRSKEPQNAGLHMKRHQQMVADWFDAARTYKGGAYNGQASLLMADNQQHLRGQLFRQQFPSLGWDQYVAPSRLLCHQLDAGDHADLVEGKHAKEIVRIIEAEIERG